MRLLASFALALLLTGPALAQGSNHKVVSAKDIPIGATVWERPGALCWDAQEGWFVRDRLTTTHVAGSVPLELTRDGDTWRARWHGTLDQLAGTWRDRETDSPWETCADSDLYTEGWRLQEAPQVAQ